MSKQSRDFYHIQDKLPLAWRYASSPRRIDDGELETLTRQINDLGKKLVMNNPELAEFIDLSAKKISLLEQAAEGDNCDERLAIKISDEKKTNRRSELKQQWHGVFLGIIC